MSRDYRNNKGMEVTQKSMKLIIDKAAAMLGVGVPKEEFKLIYPDQNGHYPGLKFQRGAAGYSNGGKFYLRRFMPEAIVFHETVHYLMGENNALLARTDGNFHAHGGFFDETIAEFATSTDYGFGPLTDRYATLYDTFYRIYSLAPLRQTAKKFMNAAHKSALIYCLERGAEDIYLETKDTAAASPEINEMLDLWLPPGEAMNPDRFRDFDVAACEIAVRNSKNLTAGSHKPSEVVELAKYGVGKGHPPHEIYLVMMSQI